MYNLFLILPGLHVTVTDLQLQNNLGKNNTVRILLLFQQHHTKSFKELKPFTVVDPPAFCCLN